MTIPVTVLIAAKNEAVNLPKCLKSVARAHRVIVVDSDSQDGTPVIAERAGAEVINFQHRGDYPKKRQWALDTVLWTTEWVLLLDADEEVPSELWDEIQAVISVPDAPNGFFITKGFHFLGQKLKYGGFSFAAVLLIRPNKARFERLITEAGDGFDMEVHERVIVDGPIGSLVTPLIHNDFKGLHAYLDRHNRYSTWEATLRDRAMSNEAYGEVTIRPRLFGNSQERRRWLKKLIIYLPGEPWLWFVYHYFFRFGFLEGRPGLIASQIRSNYIRDVRAKIYERRLNRRVAN